MLRKNLLQYHLNGDEVVPHYLSASDHPWLAELTEVFAEHADSPWQRWHDTKARGWSMSAPEGKRRMATAVLESLASARVPKTDPKPRELRKQVFRAAEQHRHQPSGRAHTLGLVASGLDLCPDEIVKHLFADRPMERAMVMPDTPQSAPELVAATNLALIQGLLRQSIRVQISLRGNARAVVRQILLRRLIAVARPKGPEGVEIDVSGVFDLFRRTTLYGRALASVVPILAWANTFRLEASLQLGRRRGRLVLTQEHRLPSPRTPKPYDSKLEQRFARDMRKHCPDWEIIREPVPIHVDGTLIFPDFELVHRDDPSRRALVEIVGFWTEDYLVSKAGRLERCGRRDLILCVDEDRCTAAAALAPSLRIVPYKRRIDPRVVVAVIETSL